MDSFTLEVASAIQQLDSDLFRNKKLLVEAINDFIDEPLTYSQWKNLWQRDLEIEKMLNSCLVKRNVTIQNEDIGTETWAYGVDETFVDYMNENYPIITGVTAKDMIPDPTTTYQKMIDYYHKIEYIQARKSSQTISFTGGPICLVNIADIHFGGAVDVKRVFEDIEIINNTPRMYINFLGDLSNNFIGSWTRKINHNSPFSIEEEHAISRYYIQQISKRLIAFTSGNHDLWTAHESGIDVMKSYLNETGCPAVYDEYENLFTLDIDGMQSIVRTRHQWLGSSQYNDTHAIEKAAKFDQGIGFDIGVGGHTHRSGLYREFNNGGKTGVAILCGTYKRKDDYARESGFPQSNKSTAVCVIVDPNSESGYHGISDIKSAAKYMEYLYS